MRGCATLPCEGVDARTGCSSGSAGSDAAAAACTRAGLPHGRAGAAGLLLRWVPPVHSGALTASCASPCTSAEDNKGHEGNSSTNMCAFARFNCWP